MAGRTRQLPEGHRAQRHPRTWHHHPDDVTADEEEQQIAFAKVMKPRKQTVHYVLRLNMKRCGPFLFFPRHHRQRFARHGLRDCGAFPREFLSSGRRYGTCLGERSWTPFWRWAPRSSWGSGRR